MIPLCGYDSVSVMAIRRCSVRYAQDDALVGAVLGGELGPDGGELVVGRATLSDDLTVPARVVVLCDQVSQVVPHRCGSQTYQVNNDESVRARVERGLDGLVVDREESLVDWATDGGGHELPSWGKSQRVHYDTTTVNIPKAVGI